MTILFSKGPQMGTSTKERSVRSDRPVSIHRFYSDRSWIEGTAEDQLEQVAAMRGVINIAAFPDLHPGKYGPVGSAILADRIYPQLIGNDIGCGMSLFVLDLPFRKLRLDKAAQKLRTLEGSWPGDGAARLNALDLPETLHVQALGTIGGGNHFCELQVVDASTENSALEMSGLKKGDLALLVHSGSRSLGTAVFSTVLDRFAGLDPDSAEGQAYWQNHCQATRWASLNRTLIAERAADALRCGLKPVTDAPHNMIEFRDGAILHRKGAAKADIPLVPLAGSRDALSYLLVATRGNQDALGSLAHGAGRKYDRRSLMGRAGATRSERNELARTSFGGLVVCEDRQLLIEEAPNAYKDPTRVLNELVDAGLAKNVASLKPLLTFKKAAKQEQSTARQDKKRRLQDRRSRR